MFGQVCLKRVERSISPKRKVERNFDVQRQEMPELFSLAEAPIQQNRIFKRLQRVSPQRV
jgi:hypothetical protein